MVEELKVCPVCGEQSLLPGERVDIGFGERLGAKVGPDSCDNCGYVEAGPDPSDPPIEHFIRCWKYHLNPWPPMPTMVKAPLVAEHRAWILANVPVSYGKCREVCAAMVEAFPNLRRVYGTYYCCIWGPRNHFWCITERNEVVDPTADQFPSKGNGPYTMQRFYGPELEKQLVLAESGCIR